MDGGTVGVMSLLAVNIALVSYSYGKLNQKVTDLCGRMKKVEDILNSKHSNPGKAELVVNSRNVKLDKIEV